MLIVNRELRFMIFFQNLQQEFDSNELQSSKGQKTVIGETFFVKEICILPLSYSCYIEPVLHPGGSESINLGLVQGLGALSLHGVGCICVCTC